MFAECLEDLFISNITPGQPLVFLCIGTDKVMGDCLGPILGHKLKTGNSNAFIYGDLENPVHAKNLTKKIKEINSIHPNAFIIAVDASIGSASHIGYITLGTGPISPGSGVNKALPRVGNIYITGIVNSQGSNNGLALSKTRLITVMKLADYIHEGIKKAGLN